MITFDQLQVGDWVEVKELGGSGNRSGIIQCQSPLEKFCHSFLLCVDSSSPKGWKGVSKKIYPDFQEDLGKTYWHISPETTILQHVSGKSQKSKGGCTCLECKTPNEYAEPNRADGAFLCYSCKDTYRWKYQ